MKILLTGANGYIGKRLLPVLIEQGHQVICCVRDKSRFDNKKYFEDNVSLFEVDFLKIDVSGKSFGTYRATGQAEHATLYARGAALFDLSQTQVKRCTANQGSTVKMDIWVTDNLMANITSTGDIHLRGNPTIELNSQGKGKLIRTP